MFNLFKRDKQQKPPVIHEHKKKTQKRTFIGARNTGMNRFNQSYAKINRELQEDYIALVLRARSLYKNNETVNSYINLMLRSILGKQGFHLNVTSYNSDGTSDLYANQQIEDLWQEYQRSIKKYVSADQMMNGNDFDRMVIFNLLVDGQVFIHRVVDKKSKFTIRYEIIDSLDVDNLYNVNYMESTGYKITMGIKTDKRNKPISYFYQKESFIRLLSPR